MVRPLSIAIMSAISKGQSLVDTAYCIRVSKNLVFVCAISMGFFSLDRESVSGMFGSNGKKHIDILDGFSTETNRQV